MPEVKLGLAHGKTSFYDPKTNTYITLGSPVQNVKFNDQTDLSGLCHAVFAMSPALNLYEGKFPQEAVDAWKAKYDLKGLKQAKNRADQKQNQSPAIEEEVEPAKVKAQASQEGELKAAAADEKPEEKPEEPEEKEEKPKRRRTAASKAKAKNDAEEKEENKEESSDS